MPALNEHIGLFSCMALLEMVFTSPGHQRRLARSTSNGLSLRALAAANATAATASAAAAAAAAQSACHVIGVLHQEVIWGCGFLKINKQQALTLEDLLSEQILDRVKELVRRAILVDGALVRLAGNHGHLHPTHPALISMSPGWKVRYLALPPVIQASEVWHVY